MKLLLYYPWHEKWPSKLKPLHIIKHGLAQIAGIVEERGIEYIYIDNSVKDYSIDHVMKLIKDNNITHIGMSLFSYNLAEGYALLDAVKAYDKSIVMFCGASHATFYMEEVLEKGFDFLLYGEGELTFMELLDKDMNPKGVLGTAYLDDDKKIVIEKQRERVTDLDALPMLPYDKIGFPEDTPGFLKVNSKNIQVTMMTSRGCRGHCVYCGNPYRKLIVNMSAERIFKEIKMLNEKYGVNEIVFFDEDLLNEEGRVEELCKLLIESGLNKKLIWTALSIRADITNTGIFKLMKEAGCYRMGMGVESGSVRVLKKMGKKISLEEVHRTVKLANEAGLITTANFTVGHLTETREDILMTSDLVNSLDVDYAAVNHLIPVPGTGMWKFLLKKGYMNPEDYSGDRLFFYSMPKYDTDNLNYKELNDLCRLVRRRYFMRPTYIFKLFKLFLKMRKVPTFSLISSAKYYMFSVVLSVFYKQATSGKKYKHKDTAES